ncbi:MAG: hypothetical protein BGO49_06040 [Planctomycetales bacterium 71-10]|nr:MAG: hypothetical protein BGO49_06040 [Planctomycetales bacterium 71-10]
MNATAAYRPRTPIDETAPYRADEDSARGGGEAAGIPPMHDLDSPRPPAGRFAFGCGDRPLEGYTIKRAVGRGGFGEVYYATSDSGKEVALKLILRNLDVERRGVVQCMNLKHPNLLTIFDLKTNDGGDAFVVMEYVAGPSLAQVLRKHPKGLPADEVRHWLKGLVEGVAYLHDHGVVHRDLKPANLFMEGGLVKIGDYGLAKLITASHGSEHSESIGTCHYMAPEIGSGKYNRPIDVYAVGVILYEMLCGRVPFDGETVNEILMKHLTARPDVSPLPEAYRGIVSKALAKDPNQRPARLYDLLLPADAPKVPDIRIIGAKGVAEVAAPADEEVHRIEAEEPIFYIGPETMPPRPSLQERMKADWRRMRQAKARREPRPPARAAGFVRAVADDAAYAPPREVRRVEAPPPSPPPPATGRARVAEATASMLWAAPLVGLLIAPAVGALGIDPARETARIVFLYGASLLATWTALVLNKVLEAREVDSTGRRVAAAMAGAAVGGGAWLLSRGLMLGDGEVLLAPLYFAGLFGATSAWYGQTTRDRKRRLRLVPIAWTLLAAAFLSPLWGDRPGEGAAIAAIAAAVVPLVSPWNEKAARYSEYVKRIDKAAGRARTA